MLKKIIFLISIIGILANANAHFISTVWKQKDIKSKQIGDSNSKERILITGYSSDFKDTIVNLVADSLTKDSIFICVMNVKELNNQKPENWKAIFIVNTCMAWDLDNKIKKYLEKNANYKSFVVLTTSGDPKGCEYSKKLPHNLDAISSASEKTKINEIVSRILINIRKNIGKYKQE